MTRADCIDRLKNLARYASVEGLAPTDASAKSSTLMRLSREMLELADGVENENEEPDCEDPRHVEHTTMGGIKVACPTCQPKRAAAGGG